MADAAVVIPALPVMENVPVGWLAVAAAVTLPEPEKFNTKFAVGWFVVAAAVAVAVT